eukprot:458874_1
MICLCRWIWIQMRYLPAQRQWRRHSAEPQAEAPKAQAAAQHRRKQVDNDPFTSLDVDPNAMFAAEATQPKHEAIQSGNDVILGMFSADPVVEAEPLSEAEPWAEPKHRCKQASDDPFAPEINVFGFDIETEKAHLKFSGGEHDRIMKISYMIGNDGYLIVNHAIVSQDIDDFKARIPWRMHHIERRQ